MKIFSQLFDVESSFRNEDDVKQSIASSKNYKNEPADNAKSLNFFKTSKQRSYLIATDEMVYCIVDDKRKEKPKVNWSQRKPDFRNTIISVKSKSDRTGLIDFGERHKNWLYSKSEFESVDDLKEQVSKLLSDDDV